MSYIIPSKYHDARWKLVERIAADLASVNIKISTEHLRIWRPELLQAVDKWVTRELLVREGKHKSRLACPSFLCRLYVPKEQQEELMNRGRPRRPEACSRTDVAQMPDANLVEKLLRSDKTPPGRCDQSIFDRGDVALIFAGPRSWMIEAWVTEVRKRSGVRVDWSFSGGRAVMKAIYRDGADRNRLSDAILHTWPAFQEAAKRSAGNGDGYELQVLSS